MHYITSFSFNNTTSIDSFWSITIFELSLWVPFTRGLGLTDFFYCISDVLNVSGRFNSEELSRDMTVGDDVKDEPFFEEGKNIAPQNVSALIGKTAFLTCVVRNLGKAKSVSFESACIIIKKNIEF